MNAAPDRSSHYNLADVRAQFPILAKRVNGRIGNWAARVS